MKTLLAFLFTLSSLAFNHDHSVFQKLIDSSFKLKSRQALINYKEIKKNSTLLDTYLKELSSVSLKEYGTWTKEEQLSFLINSYNAFTIKLIIDHYPVKSIKDIGSFFTSPWKKKFFTLLEKKRHLDWIEHEKIRKDFNEPRIHFAVVCASISCPNLQKRVFTPKNLNKLMNSAALEFLTDQDKNKFEKNMTSLSKIFKWYGDDFNDVEAFLEKTIKKDISKNIEYMKYNWDLNEWH